MRPCLFRQTAERGGLLERLALAAASAPIARFGIQALTPRARPPEFAIGRLDPTEHTHLRGQLRAAHCLLASRYINRLSNARDFAVARSCSWLNDETIGQPSIFLKIDSVQ